jgi:hypothetical protein
MVGFFPKDYPLYQCKAVIVVYRSYRTDDLMTLTCPHCVSSNSTDEAEWWFMDKWVGNTELGYCPCPTITAQFSVLCKADDMRHGA